MSYEDKPQFLNEKKTKQNKTKNSYGNEMVVEQYI